MCIPFVPEDVNTWKVNFCSIPNNIFVLLTDPDTVIDCKIGIDGYNLLPHNRFLYEEAGYAFILKLPSKYRPINFDKIPSENQLWIA